MSSPGCAVLHPTVDQKRRDLSSGTLAGLTALQTRQPLSQKPPELFLLEDLEPRCEALRPSPVGTGASVSDHVSTTAKP